MIYYIVVEGRCGERIVYPKWISYINKSLTQVFDLNNIADNCFYLVSGNGYPNYFKIIENAINDMNTLKIFDYLVVAVDSEDQTYEEKFNEITTFVGNRLVKGELKTIIQHPCLETWALGNKVVYRRKPQDLTLRTYLHLYNVREDDPELLPDYPAKDLNRCQFAFSYLKRILYDRHPNLTYTKSNPQVIVHEKYFSQLVLRLSQTNHIKSIKAFIDTFS